MTRRTNEHLDLDDIQGLVVRGYGRLPHATYLLMRLTDASAAGRLLGAWADDLVTPADRSPTDVAAHVALTAEGLLALTGWSSLDPRFSEPFLTGMATPYRSRLLGDVGANDPAKWDWGGPGNEPVHLAVLLFADTAARLTAAQRSVTTAAHDAGLVTVATLRTTRLGDREQFGFHDGISQPLLAGVPGRDREGDVVADGEFVLGYVNEYGQRTERPLLPASRDPEGLLPRDPDGTAADLGRNGSYLVFRTLHQDVAAFEAFLDEQADDGDGVDPVRREQLAAKLVGRWRGSGAPLTLAPLADDPEIGRSNRFAYHAVDEAGLRCPIGAHIRRANPRDSLPPSPGTEASRAVNVRHRLLRRGRSYGPSRPETDGERGLHFLCLGTNLARQYEFVQHTWVNDSRFDGLVGVEDPLVGPRVAGPATFHEPALPVRRAVTGLPQFVRVRGGAYFFLPGLRALRYLASAPTAGD